MIVVADTGPINYLILIDEIKIVPLLYDRVFIPSRVSEELRQAGAAVTVRAWIAAPPAWLQVASPTSRGDTNLDRLDPGERDAILLAEELRADKLLIDEAPARRKASRRGFPVTGTLGVLVAGAENGFVDLGAALDRLRQTNFRISRSIWDAVGSRRA
jgi:predicted nucleic acid-binding protein